jgi:hypothetical protein
MNMTIAIALISLVVWFVITIKELGVGGFINHTFGPKGGLKGAMKYGLMPIFIVVGVIEVISIIFRPMTVSLRLYGNVFAGENLLHTMGVRGADGVFRRVSELTLGQLRAQRPALLTVLSALRHDPLVEWSRRNASEDESGKLESDEAEKELEKIDLKLQGINQLRGPTALSVDGQVSQLISEATNIHNLCQMYVWWMPWC